MVSIFTSHTEMMSRMNKWGTVPGMPLCRMKILSPLMVWADNKIDRTCTDDPTGHGTRREKEKHTEKEMGRQCIGMGRFGVG